MNRDFFIEVNSQQRNHDGERICGDVFLYRYIKEEDRVIAVLSDGMGHGVKANILATLTSTMAINFTREHKQVDRIAEIIMNTLPVCSERMISYSTFTIVDIESSGKVTILEYDNPSTIVLRGNHIYDPEWEKVVLEKGKHAGKILKTCTIMPEKEDRIIFCSDGVSQSGMGSEAYPFGWERDNIAGYAAKLVSSEASISASMLSGKIVTMAHKNDNYKARDDISCATIYFREPRKLLICTGPPYEKDKDKDLAFKVTGYHGKVILCGGTTADIVARELNKAIVDELIFEDPELPPESFLEGIDLVTEGILTLQKVNELLKTYNNSVKLGKGPADKILKMIMESDEIHFIIGTRINIAHQDPNLPVDLEIRRTVVKRIARLLEEKWLKKVSFEYI
ncbi:MAG: stage II sporulation protein E [Bacteroidetes bacterium GWE2_41_25]|nr:MAG: stage II sporulation protein E [Bacteroidetes bacterium GWA2_40_15]OFY12115.1 MAG: stage II sporulation protein E [Bacteroidetes bacterium GWE2_41_25]OFY57326.1 MAG: stage II sporulation protein E [Bacteroidetes bacterium GWF2_41_9]HAM09968.1 stage II sporulation protein E [Bacteroidales bacterium]